MAFFFALLFSTGELDSPDCFLPFGKELKRNAEFKKKSVLVIIFFCQYSSLFLKVKSLRRCLLSFNQIASHDGVVDGSDTGSGVTRGNYCKPAGGDV